ncbi:MAG: 50S ribosomal protein L35 [Firmicutes bacterium]|nr:50S ribosomal protein L35 [Bacillota bacterium]
MPKMKTHKGAAKRFKKTGSGRILRNRANRIHRHTKDAAAKRALGKWLAVDKTDQKRVERLLPYE